MTDLSGYDPVTALAVDLERVKHRIEGMSEDIARQFTDVTREVKELAGMPAALSDLAETVRKLVAVANPPEPPPPPANWFDLEDGDQAVKTMTQLQDWVRHPLTAMLGHAQTMPPCWPWHPEIVGYLLALRAFHQDVYAPGASSRITLDLWATEMDKFRRRLEGIQQNCSDGLHLGEWATEIKRLSEYAGWWRLSNYGRPDPADTEMQEIPGLIRMVSI